MTTLITAASLESTLILYLPDLGDETYLPAIDPRQACTRRSGRERSFTALMSALRCVKSCLARVRKRFIAAR